MVSGVRNLIHNFWEKVDITDTCWLWTGHIYHNGYGGFSVNGRSVKAHRFSYELLIGDIPEGLEIDHVKEWGCSNRHCVNPAHLEAITHKENISRGDIGLASGQLQRSKTHCLRGHEYTVENTIIREGRRSCRECKRYRESKYRALRRKRDGK